ncbi:MAG: YveK family protein [Actinomycetota bacterium]
MNEDQGSTASLGFEHYVYVLKRQWRVIAVATVLGALVAGAFLVLAPKTVTATTTLNVNVITTDPFNPQRPASGLLDDATEAAIARSHVVATRASEMLGGSASANEIRSASTVVTSSGATVVSVDFEASTAARAIEGADAVAAAYVSFRSDQAEERITVMVESLTVRIDDLNSTLEGVNDTLASANESSAAYAQATTQRQQILTELDGLLSERNSLQSVDTTGGSVLSAAEDNELSYAPARTITLLTGIAGGFVVGIIAAFVWNTFDRRLRSAKEVSRALGAPMFATVDARREDVPAVGESADALRVTRERLLVDVYLGTTVLVIDATHAPEPSPTAINLAVVTAQAGHDVQLIVPGASVEFTKHLRTALMLRERPNGVLESRLVPTLRSFSASDGGDETQGDLLLTRQTQTAIENAGDEDLTFLVLPSSAHPASILAALRLAQSVVVVTRDRDTTVTEIRWIREEADGIDTPILGGVAERGRSRAQRKEGGITWPFTTAADAEDTKA